MTKRVGFLLLAVSLVTVALPVAAGAFEDAVRARWRGAWIVTEIETYSTCNGN